MDTIFLINQSPALFGFRSLVSFASSSMFSYVINLVMEIYQVAEAWSQILTLHTAVDLATLLRKK